MALIQENQFVFNKKGRKYFHTEIKPNEVHCKIQNYIYLLTFKHCGIRYVGKSITQLNQRMIIIGRFGNMQDIWPSHWKLTTQQFWKLNKW